MDQWTEHYFKTTAIYASDIKRKGELPHPVSFEYCPIDITRYTQRFTDEAPSEQQQYIDKAKKFIKENLGEVAEYIEISEDQLLDLAIDAIRKGWDKIRSGHTIGVMIEGTYAKGFGAVGGLFVAFDKEGISFIGFAGIAAGIAFGGSATAGVFYYHGPRDGLTGYGGDINASLAILGGIEWEGMFTGGNVGHYLGGTGGGSFALSVEMQKAWTISELVF